MTLKQGLQFFGCIAVLLSLLPLIAADYWWIRMFDFPHLQLTAITLGALIAYFWKFEIRDPNDYLFVCILIGCLLFQGYKIYPFTPLSEYEMYDADAAEKEEVRLFTANVLQSNTTDSLLVERMRESDPDLVLLTETDVRWLNDLEPFTRQQFAYKKEVPLDNTYGMLLYSKLPLLDPTVHYMVDDSIPSIHTRVRMPGGDTLQLFCIHPTPPMPLHNPKSTDRDAELMRTARLSRQNPLPVIVLGDFNDVAWSASTSLFKRVGRLLDLRRGRGFYNTYNAKNPFLRWPLDHVFAQSEFRLREFRVEPGIGSDHFPIFIRLAYQPEKAGEQPPEPASSEDLEKAGDIIGKEIKEDGE